MKPFIFQLTDTQRAIFDQIAHDAHKTGADLIRDLLRESAAKNGLSWPDDMPVPGRKKSK